MPLTHVASRLARSRRQAQGLPRLAAALIMLQTSAGLLASTLRALAIHFSRFSPNQPPLPASFDELCQIIEGVEGVRFRELFETLPRRAGTGDEALRQVVEMAREAGAQQSEAAEVG